MKKECGEAEVHDCCAVSVNACNEFCTYIKAFRSFIPPSIYDYKYHAYYSFQNLQEILYMLYTIHFIPAKVIVCNLPKQSLFEPKLCLIKQWHSPMYNSC